MARASNGLTPLTLELSLRSALHDISTTESIAAAEKLIQTASGSSTRSIHLRSLGIDHDGAARIGYALTSISNAERVRLLSFSLSYNEIGDDGASALAAALPATLGELGMVGCSIGDNGGKAILNWARAASQLRMICLEGNAMSPQMRDRFAGLRNTVPGLAVYV